MAYNKKINDGSDFICSMCNYFYDVKKSKSFGGTKFKINTLGFSRPKCRGL